MKWNILFNLFLISCVGQVTLAQPLVEIKGKADFIDVDKLENIYVINGAEIVKYNPNGKVLYRYSNTINGAITSVDVTNPLRILVFFREANVLVFLNQQLSKLSDPIDIYDIAGSEASMVGASSEGGFWAYSTDRQSVLLINQQWVKTQETQNLNSWIGGAEITFIKEYNQKVYVGLANKMLVFDMFGLYLTTLHFSNESSLSMVNGKVNYVKSRELFLFNPQLKTEVVYNLSLYSNCEKAFSYADKIYIINNLGVLIYKAEH